MENPFALDRRCQGLFILTGLAVAYVRNYVEYSRYTFDSLWEFLGFWLIHYFAVMLVGAVFYSVLWRAELFFLGSVDERKRASIDEALVYFCLTVLICSIVIFVLAHWPAGLAEDYFSE